MKMLGLRSVCVLLVSMFGAASSVAAHGGNKNAVHACVNVTTQATRIVAKNSSCKTTEVARHWPSSGPFIVEDAKGQMLGPAIINPATLNQNRVDVLLVVPEIGHVYATVTTTEISPNGSYTLFYESNDCSGQPYFSPRDSGPRLFWSRDFATGKPGNTIYIPDGTALSRVIVSSCQADGLCHDCAGEGNVVPAIPVVDLNTRFTPPFRLRTR